MLADLCRLLGCSGMSPDSCPGDPKCAILGKIKALKGAMMSDQKFFGAPQPAIVQVKGHVTLAGWVTEESHFGTEMCRVDVPSVSDVEGFTIFYEGQTLYSVTPCDKVTMLEAVRRFRPRPIAVYVLPDRQIPATVPVEEIEENWEEGYDVDDEGPTL